MAETPKRVININGVQFRRDPTGKKLIRQTGDSPAVKSKTPKQVLLNGLPYVRSKRGNLVLSRKTSLVKSPSLRRKSSIKARKFCNFYRFGKCDKGAKCRFVHDPKRLAVCPAYIKGECTKGVECKLSHSPTKENMPTCLHFERGRCRKEDCFYLHVKLSADAPVCRSFALEGYCEAGDECRNRHVYQCPDFAAGKCTNEKCRLPHKVAKKRELPPKHVGKGKRPLSKEEQEAQDKEDEELMKLPIRPDFSIEPEVFAQKLREAQAGRDGNESDSDDFDIGDEQLLYWPMEDDSPVGEEGHEGSDHSLNEDEPEDDNDDEDQPEEDDDDDAEDDAEAGGSDDSEPEVIELFSESDEDGSSDEEDGSPFVTSPTRLPPSQTIDLTDD
ncbi:hypothetical protein DFS34DRAFT_618702 [Phlyctochytrium arcticum]|nr:hypothetical protein DFS34DRAFT_618702 [Phlyctochytrium arcticum]